MADDSHHGEGEHDERDMAVPAMPGARFVVIETELVLGGFEAVLNSPAAAFDRYELFHGRALGTPRGEEGEVAVGNVAADQQTARPLAFKAAVVFRRPRDRPVRDRPSHAGAGLWFLRPPIGAARHFWEDSPRSSQRCRQ